MWKIEWIRIQKQWIGSNFCNISTKKVIERIKWTLVVFWECLSIYQYFYSKRAFFRKRKCGSIWVYSAKGRSRRQRRSGSHWEARERMRYRSQCHKWARSRGTTDWPSSQRSSARRSSRWPWTSNAGDTRTIGDSTSLRPKPTIHPSITVPSSPPPKTLGTLVSCQ